jgi:hypothetical protein
MNLSVNYQLILTYVTQETEEEQNLFEFRKKSKILPFN